MARSSELSSVSVSVSLMNLLVSSSSSSSMKTEGDQTFSFALGRELGPGAVGVTRPFALPPATPAVVLALGLCVGARAVMLGSTSPMVAYSIRCRDARVAD